MNAFNPVFSCDRAFLNLANRLVSFESIMQDPIPPINWLVQSLISTGTRTVVFGEFGSMKSWALLDLSLHIAAGHPWLDTFPVPQPQAVLFIDEEMPERELRRRVKRLGEGMGLQKSSIPFQSISHLGVRFQEGKIDALLDALHKAGFDPDIIVVETLRRVLSGSENEAVDVGEFWQSVGPLLTAGKTLIISHHMKKPNVQGGTSIRHRASGSTDILAGADAAYAITREDDHFTISCVKNRVAVELEPFRVAMEDDGSESGPVVLRYVGKQPDIGAEQSKIEWAKEQILVFLADQLDFTATTDCLLGYLKEQGITQRTGERALQALCMAGVLEKMDHGRYRLPPGPRAI